MVDIPFSKGSESITQAEHVSPDKTGDNIEAKRTAGYGFDVSAGVWRRLSVDADGKLNTTASISGDVTAATEYTDGSATIAHPVGGMQVFDNAGTITSVSNVNPLPVSASVSIDTTGLATDTGQDTGNASLTSIDTKLDALTTPSDTQPISAASLPLPSGASTSAKQDTGNTSLASIDGKITAVNTGAVVVSSSALPTGAATSAKQPALGTAGTPSSDVITVQGKASMTPLLTDASATTQPVSAASLPLPTGAATGAKQDTGNTSLASIDGKVTTVDTDNVTIVDMPAVSVDTTGLATSAKQDTGNTSLGSIDTKITAVDTGNVTVSASALPTGASTAAKQDTGNTTLSAIDTKLGGTLTVDTGLTTQTDALTDTELRASDVKVSLDGESVAVTGTFWQATQPVSAASLPLPSGAATAAKQPALGTAGTASTDVLSVQGITSMTPLKVDGSGVTQPVSGTVTANLSATDNAVLDSIDSAVNGTLAVDASGTTVPVSGTFWQATQPISHAALDDLADGTVELTAFQGGAWTVDISGSNVSNTGTFAVQNTETRPATPTLANVTMTGSSVTLQASNTARRNLMIFNDSGVTVYVKLGSAASSSSFTVKMADQGYYELPTPVYTGIVTALGASGSVRVTEVV